LIGVSVIDGVLISFTAAFFVMSFFLVFTGVRPGLAAGRAGACFAPPLAGRCLTANGLAAVLLRLLAAAALAGFFFAGALVGCAAFFRPAAGWLATFLAEDCFVAFFFVECVF
jgi:hypothetical protein